MYAATLLQLEDFRSQLHEIAFKEDATVQDLLTIAVAWAVVWFVVFSIATPLIRSVTYGKPWLRAMVERDYEASKEMMEVYFGEMSKEELVEKMMKGWAGGQVVNFQHTAGALLCIPVLFGIGDSSWANSLAILGLFSEMGYEIESFVVDMAYTRWRYGAKEMPNAAIIGMIIHHGITTILAIPMALYYRHLRALHWLTFDLQAGATCCLLMEYSKTLDVSKHSDLQRFKMMNLFMVAVMGWTRCFHYIYLIATIILTWYHDKAWGVMALGTLPVLAFSAFNYMGVTSMWKRFMKFRNASAEHESLSLRSDVSEQEFRKSVARLDILAGELNLAELLDPGSAAASFLELFEERKVERRQTMPPRKMKLARGSMKSLRLLRGMSVPALNQAWKEE